MKNNPTPNPDYKALISKLVFNARKAQGILGKSSFKDRCRALDFASKSILNQRLDILNANKYDLVQAKKNGLSKALIDRLTLTEDRIEDMAMGLDTMSKLGDPIGIELARWTQPNGLDISRISTPLGVIGIIYESRPNVTVDSAGLCVISGNAVILRPGSDSYHTSNFLTTIMADSIEEIGLPKDSIQAIPTSERLAVGAMLTAVGEIDVIIPRGGRSLVERVQTEARVPVFSHLEGICHVYIESNADPKKARDITINAKMRRTGICGAAETLLIDKSIAEDILGDIATDLIKMGCALRGDFQACKIVPEMIPASQKDWQTEYLDAILAVKVVDDIDMAISHITNYGSSHTETIITESKSAAEKFLSEIDSAIVMHNTSTQFADGGEFGMGAEIGIATGRLHARGPVGAKQLTSFKYVVRSDGQTRK